LVISIDFQEPFSLSTFDLDISSKLLRASRNIPFILGGNGFGKTTGMCRL
jgi:hypothetical protein